jgi:hypothetical protein
MYALASTTASILRGTTTNAWGDEVDDPNAAVIATGVPVCLDVTNTNAFDPTTQQIRTIRSIHGSIQSDTDVRETDRLRDDASGVIYIVESVTDTLGPGFVGDLELVLKQVA